MNWKDKLIIAFMTISLVGTILLALWLEWQILS